MPAPAPLPGRSRLRLVAPVLPVALVQLVGSAAAVGRGPDRWGEGGWSGSPHWPAALGAGAVVLLLAGPVALLARYRAPLVAQAVAALAVLGWALGGWPRGPVWAALAVATVSAVVGSDAVRRRALHYGVTAATWALVWLAVPAARGEPAPSPAVLGSLAWLLVLAAASEVVRARRAAAADRRQRAEQAALAEAEERRRRASDERLAVARELHDVLGHSLSLITVQSGVALELMRDRPEVAREALTAIRAASRDALVEVHAVLASLRSPHGPSPETETPRAPAPSVGDLDGLVTRARAAGLHVDTRTEGDVAGLPVAVDLAAARIVQEALTNTARHAHGAAAAVLVRRTAAGLMVRVDDDGPAPGAATPGAATPPRGGSGLPGMRERATALGGRLAAGPRAGGGWRVEAELPVAP